MLVILGYFSFRSLLKGHDLLFVQREEISSQILIALSPSWGSWFIFWLTKTFDTVSRELLLVRGGQVYWKGKIFPIVF